MLKIVESYPGNGRQIDTPNGFRDILFVHKTIPLRTCRIVLDNALTLECAFNHVVISCGGKEVFAKDCFGETLLTVDGPSRVVGVQDLRVSQHMYDISVDSDDELYYSNGILSHNSGKSITTAIYLLHKYNFNKDLNIGIVANKGSMAREFLNNVKNMFIELPIWMQQGTEVWNKGSIENELGMRILTDVPSSDSFRGFTISLLVCDEVAFIKPTIWDAFSDSIFPSQSGLAWKKNIIISTCNGMNHFYEIVKDATEGNSGVKVFEVDWKDVPRYKPDGSLMSPPEFMNKIVNKHGLIYFNQNYANEWIGSSHTLISAEQLTKMKHSEFEEIRDGKLRIYKYPQQGHKYIMTVDAAKDGRDAFAIQVVDITNFHFEQVAAAQLQIDYLLMPEFIVEWCKYYKGAYLIIENNEGAGQSIADQIYRSYEYENMYFDKAPNEKKRKKYPGFRTTLKTRKQILQTLKLFVDNSKLAIHDKTTIDELHRFILLNNKYQADNGAKDDMVMSLAMVFVPFCDVANFEDMPKVVKGLYVEENADEDFVENLVIGSFDDGVLENEINDTILTSNPEEYVLKNDGFL